VDPAGAAVTAAEEAVELLLRLRGTRPLVHHITTMVTAYDVAAATLALGGSPVMALAPEEVEEVAARAGALALNMGTLTPHVVEAMCRAGRAANRAGVPVVLDPVGVGASAFRSREARRILGEVRVACIRGNAGEIASLGGHPGFVRGVEAVGDPAEAARWAVEVARATGSLVAATGPVDVVTDGSALVRVHNGHPLLAHIPGSGCMATAAVAAFLAVGGGVGAVAGALVCVGVAAEIAASRAEGPGTFRGMLLDALAGLDAATVRARARVER
jgi:hydroxyethylthiazole kinase